MRKALIQFRYQIDLLTVLITKVSIKLICENVNKHAVLNRHFSYFFTFYSNEKLFLKFIRLQTNTRKKSIILRYIWSRPIGKPYLETKANRKPFTSYHLQTHLKSYPDNQPVPTSVIDSAITLDQQPCNLIRAIHFHEHTKESKRYLPRRYGSEPWKACTTIFSAHAPLMARAYKLLVWYGESVIVFPGNRFCLQ